jgi:tRNA(Ile)-lysidine synthase
MNALPESFSSLPQPIGESLFAELMEACGPWDEENPRFAVAVSGGPDSMALAVLLKEWLHPRGGTLLAIHVDHRLRENSGEEAKSVGRALATHKIPRILLRWDHESPPQSAVHFTARKARYDLLAEECRLQGITHLFLAHHADDQAETVFMRLARSTGIDGMAGMAIRREQDGITLVRPLLPVRKAVLEATCHAREIEFLRDPSNTEARFMRGKLRAMQAPLSEAGFSPERLYEIARLAGTTRAYLEEACNLWLQSHASFDAYGTACLSTSAWKELDLPMQLRVLNRVLMAVSGAEYPPRGASLERLTTQLLLGGKACTLNGCFIQPSSETLLFTREEGLAEKETPANTLLPHRRWDNRFLFSFQDGFQKEKLFVRPLGKISRQLLTKKGAEQVAELPLCVRRALPGFFSESGLFLVPEFTTQNEEMESQALVTAVFSPPRGFLVKPFCPSSFIMI